MLFSWYGITRIIKSDVTQVLLKVGKTKTRNVSNPK